jgi:heme/copper-type cytochrome/quinol oxidase subunit 2
LPIPSPTFRISPSSSPTQQPTIEPTQTADNTQVENFTSVIIVISLVIVAVTIGLLAYVAKHKRLKQSLLLPEYN